MAFTRRELLKCLAAGGAVVAGELWVPGQKIISIPKKVYDYSVVSVGMPEFVATDLITREVIRQLELNVQLSESLLRENISMSIMGGPSI